MKIELLTAKLRQDPQWESKHVVSILVEDLINDDKEGSQVRAGDIIPSHVSDLADDIAERGLMVPITIDQDNNVVEGNHRVQAYRELGQSGIDGSCYETIKAYRRTFADDQEKKAYQLKCNSHLPAKSSTNADYALVVSDELKNGCYPGMTWENFNDKSSNFNDLIDLAHQKYKRLGIGKNRAKAIVKIAIGDAPNSKLQNYTKAQVIQDFSDNNSIGWSGKKAGDESNGNVVYTLANMSHIFPNLTGNSFNKKTNTRNGVDTVAIIWQSNIYGKTGADIDEFRKNAVNKINTVNNSLVLKKGVRLIDEIYVVPQKLRGQKETSKVFKRVQKDSRGNFIPGKLPTSGW